MESLRIISFDQSQAVVFEPFQEDHVVIRMGGLNLNHEDALNLRVALLGHVQRRHFQSDDMHLYFFVRTGAGYGIAGVQEYRSFSLRHDELSTGIVAELVLNGLHVIFIAVQIMDGQFGNCLHNIMTSHKWDRKLATFILDKFNPLSFARVARIPNSTHDYVATEVELEQLLKVDQLTKILSQKRIAKRFQEAEITFQPWKRIENGNLEAGWPSRIIHSLSSDITPLEYDSVGDIPQVVTASFLMRNPGAAAQ